MVSKNIVGLCNLTVMKKKLSAILLNHLAFFGFLIVVIFFFYSNLISVAQENQTDPKNPWPELVVKAEIPSSDGSKQSAMWYLPLKDSKKPLLVGLHTWSNDYSAAGADLACARWCIQEGWAFIHPNFRGRNRTPESMGSDRAVEDIVEAVRWAQKQTDIDESRIYLIGVSGGGHMALLLAGRHPEIWAGVSAWCGISDIAQWHRDHLKEGKPDGYAKDIQTALGGDPDKDPKILEEALHRSPVNWLKNAQSLPLDIQAGFFDGRKGSVPFRHSLVAFNKVVKDEDRLKDEDIRSYYETQQLPPGWSAATPDATYNKKDPVFRKESGNTRVTIFTGGHEMVQLVALNWLAQQRKGQTAVWEVKNFIKIDSKGLTTKSGL
jgi:pimeloyl-ACP methyl ester carboxylesterase